MMTTVLAAISDFGLPAVLGALAVYVVLKGEFVFRYPSRREGAHPTTELHHDFAGPEKR